jgi:hypothetical protein
VSVHQPLWVSPDPVSPTSTSSAMKSTENTGKDPVDSEPAGVGDIQMDYLLINCTYQVQEQ